MLLSARGQRTPRRLLGSVGRWLLEDDLAPLLRRNSLLVTASSGDALASVSCALPIFLAAIGIVVGSGLTVGTFLDVVLGSLSYSLGMGLVMTGVTMSALFFENSLSRIISRATIYVDILGKIAMLGAGFYLMWYWLVGDGRVILELRLDQLIS